MDPLQRAATTIRQPAYAEVCIDSTDRYKDGYPAGSDLTTTSSNWQTNLSHYALQGYFTRLALTQVQFQWNLPTIIAGYNDTFTVLDAAAGALNLVLSAGYYTPASLAAQVQTKLQAAAAGSGYTCIFDPAIKGLVIEAATSTFTIAVAPLSSRNKRCLQTLGFLVVGLKNPAPPPNWLNIAFGAAPTCLPTRYINVHSSYLAKFQDVKDATTSQAIVYNDILCRIFPVPGNYRIDITEDNAPGSSPFVVNLDYSTAKQVIWNPAEAVGNFDIQLRDEYGDIIPYDTQFGTFGCEYVMTLLASEN